MSIKNFIPELWNETLLSELEKTHVYGRVCRCKIDAPIQRKGDTVHITGIGDIDFTNYTGTRVPLQMLDDTGLTMVIDQAKAFNFAVDDVDAFQANGDVMREAIRKAAYKRRDIADIYLASILAEGAGLSTTPVAGMTTTLIISSIAEMGKKLSEANVPVEQQWISIPTWAYYKLMLAGVFHAQDLKNNINGFVTKVLGPDIYTSNNVPRNGDTYYPLAGSYGAAAYAEQIISTEAYRPQNGLFCDAIQGLHVYGSKVVKPNELVKAEWTEAIETNI